MKYFVCAECGKEITGPFWHTVIDGNCPFFFCSLACSEAYRWAKGIEREYPDLKIIK